MSENIQAISQQNYILATQQEVSHDNSLSGNGTVESPLGVVPGYNETVLYATENINSGITNTFTASEPFSAFERVRILYGRSFSDAHFIEFSGSQQSWNCANYMVQNANIILDASLWNISNNVITKQYDERRSLTSAYKRETGSFPKGIFSIVGINRKAQ